MMQSTGSGIRIVIYDEQQSILSQIRSATIESIESFQELSSCVSSIEQDSKDKIVILITTTDDENTLASFDLLTSIEGILILSASGKDIDTLPNKVIGVYPQTELLSRALSESIDSIERQLNVKSVLSNCHVDGNDNLVFYFYYLWKNYVKDQNSTKKILSEQAKLTFRSSNQIKTNIDEFERSYKPGDVLRWLDKHRHSFPYHILILNALRTHNEQLLSLSRFFLNDIHKQMKPTPAASSSNQVYLGTKLSLNLVDLFEKQTNANTIAFQCFLPVTRSRAAALLEATKPTRRLKLANVLFKIDLNGASCATMDETLFIDMATPFQILCVTKGSGTGQQLLTVIKLKALGKTEIDQLYEQFIERQKKLGKTIDDLLQRISSDVNDEEELADEHMKRNEWAQAADILARIKDPNVRVLNKRGCLLREHLNDLSGALDCHQLALNKTNNQEKASTLYYMGIVYNAMKQHAEAYKTFHQALQLFESEKKKDLPMIARCLVGLSNVQLSRKHLDEALDYCERALAMREFQIKPRNESDIAACLSNMGNILHEQGNKKRAIECATRAIDLMSSYGKDDPRFAAALNNLGAIHQSSGDLVKARECYTRALESFQNENHAYRKSTLANIARLDMIEQKKT